ncbi:MAG: hypothetical protein KUG71_06650 [Porticoccaceae bacterium]|nr:hypothetical protein [Porticoccaceae bacterium]
MTRSTKAALLSALIFPGAGHAFLKKYLQAMVLGLVSFISVYYLLSMAMEKALQISEKILVGEVPLDIAVITDLISGQAMESDMYRLNYATTAFIICWIIGVVDSYRVGEQLNVMK